MKKILLGTTGLFAAVMLMSSPAASAEKIKLGLGGYMQQWVGFVDQDVTGLREFDQQSDSEVYFTGSTKLDNGLTVMAHIQLEGDRTARTRILDDTWMSISSEQMGTLQLGNVPAVTMSIAGHRGVDVGIGIDDPNSWVTDTTAWSTQWQGDGPWSFIFSDDHKVQYVSPSFQGFQVAALYIPEYGEGGNNAMPAAGATAIVYGAGVVYNGDFDGVSVGFDAAIAQADMPATTTEMDMYQIGLSVGVSGFKVAGGYMNADWGNLFEHTTYDIGASYASGPYAVSLTWAHSEEDVGNADYDQIQGSARYTMGPGVQLRGTIFHMEADNAGIANDNEGWGVVGGVALTF